MSVALVDKEKKEDLPVAAEGNEREPVLQNIVKWSDSLWSHVRELWSHRELLLLVTQREIKVRYKQTALGAAWAVLQPLSLMLVFTVFFSHFAKMPSDGTPYALFYYTGLLPWTFFATSLTFAVPSLITNANIITKIYFPREIIPLASVLAAFVDFLVATLIYVVLLVWYQITPTWNMLYALPLLLVQIIFTAGICLALSAFTVLYRDVRFTLPLLVQIWMFATPILYPASAVTGKLGVWYMTLNPMAAIIDGYRRAITLGQPPEMLYLANAAVVSLALLWLGYKYFKHLEREFADIV
ncbi:MAG TPA: ABC transporter permease [Blastocatellia bacterium]|nr:ABC transporter permease [Blastocatellia bacterium]